MLADALAARSSRCRRPLVPPPDYNSRRSWSPRSTRRIGGVGRGATRLVQGRRAETVIYPSGHNVVIFNTEQKTQKFIPGTENTEGITAMAVSPNHKYVAVAERAKEGEKAQVTIFDLHTLKRRKVQLQAAAPPEGRPRPRDRL